MNYIGLESLVEKLKLESPEKRAQVVGDASYVIENERMVKAVTDYLSRPLSEQDRAHINSIRDDVQIPDCLDMRLALTFWGDKGPEPDENRDAHTEHCCIDHGCKYDHDDCTVANGMKRQTAGCYYCYADEYPTLRIGVGVINPRGISKLCLMRSENE